MAVNATFSFLLRVFRLTERGRGGQDQSTHNESRSHRDFKNQLGHIYEVSEGDFAIQKPFAQERRNLIDPAMR
jgi:hypothetical protein